MGKNSGRKKSHRKNHKKKKERPAARDPNFVSEAGPGCFIARRGGVGDAQEAPDWMIGWEDVDPADFVEDGEALEVPDIALDPEECTVSVCNLDAHTKVAYVTVFETAVIGAHGRELTPGSTTDNDGKTLRCVTFVVLCPPFVFAHLGYLDLPEGRDLSSVVIESDVSEWRKHPDPSDEHPCLLGFPLGQAPGTTTASYLCTQGEDGELTHFFSGNLHAIDFRCPIGTEVLAVADGVVAEAGDENTLTGIAVTNLFRWNSILLEVGGDRSGGGPLLVEYVHLSRTLVRAGDRVAKGQVLGYSGSVGFSPEPHLHFSAFRSPDPGAPTVRVRFEGKSPGGAFLPRAGEWYDAGGRADPPPRAA
ncbi:unnamed protein product [Pseudo-nitzschia multistriata]|uniref:M23ase beta-sheet core domain-containing protein n=1 Tax=Pseudo-nitzschia multistriata TaxID=183589 RepID=A0A448YXD9_9STRA|nr:unnamed protein product [Pseudo-nitzschia multistriata]